ncbi:MAG TPA: hypothetical protein PLF35_05385 [Prolixibacteraceae bacterium]|nr:hypothetical protein [Prolixibacteraceae bacterium]
MKNLPHYLLALLLSLFIISACSDEEIIPEDEPGTETGAEELPPDDDPVNGSIEGSISELDYNETQSASVVTINRIPHTIDKFLELRSQIAHTPQGAAVMMIVAMRICQQYPDEGMKCLVANSTSPLIGQGEGSDSYNGMKMLNTSELKRKLNDYSYLPMVYFLGASPANGYTPEGPPFKVETSVNQYSYVRSTAGSTRIKVFIATQDADSARPVTVRKMGDYYSVTEFSSLYLAPKNLNN